MRTIIGCLFALLAGASIAQVNCTQYRCAYLTGSEPWTSSASAACAALIGRVTSGTTTIVTSTASGGSCQLTMSNEGTGSYPIETREGPYCNPCADSAGQSIVINRTTGWSRTSTPDANDAVIKYDAATSVCNGQCRVSIESIVARSCERSQVPGPNGLHRNSCDYNATLTNEACSTVDAEVNPSAPEPPCPGALGYVNGKRVCVGTSGSPLPALSDPSGPIPEGYGNPAAGQKPTTGPGSGDGPGRTPTEGSGGNSGGGSNAATPGGGSDGNGQVAGGAGGGAGTEIDLETCGLPGKPPCKIDESGTPDGTGAFTGAQTAWDAAKQSELDGINSPTRQRTTAPWMWGFATPTGVCSPISGEYRGKTYTFDACNSPVIAFVRMVLGWFIACCGGLYIWRSLTASPPSGGK